ncbi:MAG: isocitrate lyase/phosphoenolpyruvate mutase family protein [Alphaproteobacteria bacterium]|nr:isocitrate lyase/phosphoenolpyruvate mutase family protein [Alphaproteobacteria bacterium]MBU2085836.1 isocitrate lyase/phosphoenolpyruvate mutase family protein [Alphaproteobacteria bacterium]MBU2143870.1 isocitrate lyase/phosphoenolpyruvate mutase family protein [Alphaproteobacteria bacterium]MBU2197985.1 isocitrate lyase/phosphoenolpyruvate mutase family protein [Alphaproteobacteria bacterium]
MTTQKDKAFAFKALHDNPGMFVLPNPWDVGSARMLAGLGFKALASTSAGFAASTGVADYQITRDLKLAHIRALAPATPLPLTADLENGFGHSPETCAETIRLGAEAGLVGGSIEDFTGDDAAPQYEIAEAAERVRAAVEAANALPFPFLVTARAENFFTGVPDLADVIARLQAYQEAGAHVLYAPGLKTMDEIKTVLAAVDRPINVLMGPRAGFVPMAELEALGVKRVSMGASLAYAAYGALVRAGEELLGPGTLGFLEGAAPGNDLAELMAKGADS